MRVTGLLYLHDVPKMALTQIAVATMFTRRDNANSIHEPTLRSLALAALGVVSRRVALASFAGDNAMGKRTTVCSGDRYGRLLITEEAPPSIGKHGRKRRRFHCRCDCGNTTTALLFSLTSGNTTSCGCRTKEVAVTNGHKNKTHGMAGTNIYAVWSEMIRRCHNPSCNVFHHYGGRGISVCDRWRKSFECFLEDMGMPPKGMSLDRIDNEAGYSKENCRWATRKQQSRNTRRNRLLTLNGETMCLAEWAERIGVSAKLLGTRIYTHKWPIEKALTTAPRVRSNNE